jgi:steroid 5-alpha reductase family enzyme
MNSISKQRLAQALGLAGLIPFLFLALGVVDSAQSRTPSGAWLIIFMVAYGAVILSFVGALHWALCLRCDELGAGWLVWSIVPSLIGWVALCGAVVTTSQFRQQKWMVALLIVGFAVQLVADFLMRGILTSAVWPDWFMRLRIQLTVVVCASLAVLLFIG